MLMQGRRFIEESIADMYGTWRSAGSHLVVLPLPLTAIVVNEAAGCVLVNFGDIDVAKVL